MGKFTGHVALITGASSGIGAALAREFARQGADVSLVARRVDRIEALAQEIKQSGRGAIAIRGDVTVSGDLERAAGTTREAFGKIDIVVANAGFGVVGPLSSLTLDDYRRQFETNVFGVLRTLSATLDDLKKTHGRLVIIGSISGHLGTAGASPYVMSKFAVRGLAECLFHELAAEGVSVTLISPGFVESEIRQVDNLGRWHPKAADVVPRWLIMPTERAARQIVRAIARRRREAVITGHGKVTVFLQRHTPRLLAWVIRRFGVKGRPEPSDR
jgi:short-subunit dehydrogenase